MGEYIKYHGEEFKIGTVENLYYTSFQKYLDALKSGALRQLKGNASPESYALPDSGYRFRFPFPDEDQLKFGQYPDNFERGVPITCNVKDYGPDAPESAGTGTQFLIEISQQKLVHREEDGKLILALVCRDPLTGEKFRIEDDEEMKKLLGQIVRNHISVENDIGKKKFYRTLAIRILKGYRVDAPAMKIKTPLKKTAANIKRSQGKGRRM